MVEMVENETVKLVGNPHGSDDTTLKVVFSVLRATKPSTLGVGSSLGVGPPLGAGSLGACPLRACPLGTSPLRVCSLGVGPSLRAISLTLLGTTSLWRSRGLRPSGCRIVDCSILLSIASKFISIEFLRQTHI